MAKSTQRGGAASRASEATASPSACVGVAARATAREALTALLSSLPADTGAAFILTFRHETEHPSIPLVEALRAISAMPLQVATDETVVEPNQIYVARDQDLVTVEEGRLRVRPADPDDGRIDSLLVSVAEAYEETAVVVVFQDLGAEGAAGVAATKRCGGFAIAEGGDDQLEPEALAISAAGLADLRAPAGRIAGEIFAYLANLVRTADGEIMKLKDDVGQQIAWIAAILRNATGNDLSPRSDRPEAGGESAWRPDPPRPLTGRIGRRVEQVAERYAPAYLVVDENYDVLHCSGRTGRFLEPATGAASLNLLNLVHRDLRLDLRTALHKAVSQRDRAEARNVRLGVNGSAQEVNIVVEPIASGEEIGTLVVLFQDAGTPAEGTPAGQSNGGHDEHVRRLEAELRVTKERLQTTIEELESTNEELETSKEELQAVNEELQTVNSELAHRVGDLARADSDFKNLLESTQIATIFLDNELKLRSFTPASADAFRLIEADVGRPIAHITARVAYPELQDDARRVLKTLGQVEREVSGSEEDRHFLVRVLPYRSVDNFIAGVAVTFLEVTGTARAEAALRASERRFGEAQQLAGVGVWEWNLATDQSWWSPGVYQLWGLTSGDAPPPLAERRIHPDDRAVYATALAEAKATGELNVEWRVIRPDGSVGWLAETGRMERSDGGRMLGVIQDITARKVTETHLTMLLGELQHRVRDILGVVRSVVARTARSSSNVEDLAASLDGRLDTLARTQGVFARDVSAIELEDLIRNELVSVAAREDQLTVQGPPVKLKRIAAEAFALALHELTTNAVKYGALFEPAGRLSVTWRILNTSKGPQLSLHWRESGVRALDVRPSRSGFGRELIERSLPYELGADTSLEFGKGGVRAAIQVPLTDRIADLESLRREQLYD